MTRRFGLRRRLVLWLIALVTLTVVLVGAASVILAERSLRARLVDEILATTEFNLNVLVPATGLTADSAPEDVEESGLIDRFLRRGTDGAWVEYPVGTRLSGGLAPIDVDPALREIADRGEIGYQFTGPLLVSAARLPPDGPTFFFVASADTVAETVRQLVTVVVIVGAVAIAAGTLLASRAARRMLRPVAAAREAAELMAAGELEVRMAEGDSDEFGRLSSSFNRMAASLNETIQELDFARARERRFVADVSHELRTPLTGLVNAAQMLLVRVQKGEQVTDDMVLLASMLERDVGRLRHLVDDLLEISRLDSHAEPEGPTEIDLEAFLAAVVEERHPSARLTVSSDGHVSIDGRSLERVVGNLLDNARLHAPGADVSVEAENAGTELIVTVADRGPGVPPDALPRLFERFYTSGGAKTASTGLGLAIVARHVERMKGNVSASLRKEGGLRVTVRIPVAQPLHNGEAAAISTSQSGE